MEVLTAEMVACKDPSVIASLEVIVWRDRYVVRMVPALKVAFTALAQHFSGRRKSKEQLHRRPEQDEHIGGMKPRLG
jgi:hypothetical protein